MNEETAKQLKNNPHYKPNAKQRKEIDEKSSGNMIQFGSPIIHNTHLPKTNGLKRRKYHERTE